MSAESPLSRFIQSGVGKAAVGGVVLVAVGLLVFEFTQMGGAGQSRQVSPQEFKSEAQQQIDAINKMTNLTPEQKQSMIEHEQGEIERASGKKTPAVDAAGHPMPGK